MIRIAFIHDGPVFYDDSGTFYEYAYHGLYERYSRIGDEVTFLMRTKPAGTINKLTPMPTQLSVVSVPNFKKPMNYLSAKKEAERIIHDCVSANDCFVLRLQSSIAEIAIRFINEQGKPYIVESVGCPWDSYWNHSMLGKIVAPYAFLKTRSIIGKADYVYYVTEEFLQRRYPCKRDAVTLSCSNVVLDEINEDAASQRMARKKLSGDYRGRIILGTAAAIDTRYKGQQYVIRSIPKLEAAGYQVEYWLAGGKNRDESDDFLERIAASLGVRDKVVFLGSLSKEEMRGFYDCIDIYVQPSKQEGLPRALIEAMACGCPAIGSNIAGIPELLDSRFLFKKGNVGSLVSAFERLINSDLENVMQRNFDTALKYRRDILDEKRNDFYYDFLKHYFPKEADSKANVLHQGQI